MDIKSKESDKEYTLSYDDNNYSTFKLNGKSIDFEILNEEEGTFEIRTDKGKKITIDLVEYFKDKKILKLLVNGKLFEYKIEQEIDQLLKKMGMNGNEDKNIRDIVAPMPGLVLKVLVSEGDTIEAGQSILVLEAMKMENIIKATSSAKVVNLKIKIGDPVEKGQVLVELE